MPPKVIEQLFLSTDDLALNVSTKDKSLPAGRVYDAALNRAAATSEYSWLATLCPREPMRDAEYLTAEKFYTLSIVVMHRRDRAWFAPTSSSTNSIPQGERLLQVSPIGGNFVGGAGGRVTFGASQGVEDRIDVGDWVMLSRYMSNGTNLAVVCRWYRVIGRDAESQVDDATGTWTRNVTLDGPDWTFDATLPTQATMVGNVVSVFERVIEVQ